MHSTALYSSVQCYCTTALHCRGKFATCDLRRRTADRAFTRTNWRPRLYTLRNSSGPQGPCVARAGGQKCRTVQYCTVEYSMALSNTVHCIIRHFGTLASAAQYTSPVASAKRPLSEYPGTHVLLLTRCSMTSVSPAVMVQR